MLNSQQVQTNKTPPTQSKNQRGKKSHNVIFTAPLYHLEGDEGRESKASTPVSSVTHNSRPASALSINMDHSNTNITSPKPGHHKMKKSISIAAHPPVTTISPYYQYRQQPSDFTDHQQQYRSGSFSGNIQTLVSSQPFQHFSTDHLQNSLVHRPPQISRGLLGSMLTTRVRNFLAQKGSTSGSIIKLWPNMAYINSSRCQSPLSVIAQRRLALKQQK